MAFIDDKMLQIDDVNHKNRIDICRDFRAEMISQEMYDLMRIHDPCTIYCIYESNGEKMYLGDILISRKSAESKYFVGVEYHNKIEYVLYLNTVSNYHDHLIPISRYDNPQEAFLEMVNKTNIYSQEKINHALYESLVAYIDGNISINDLIIGVICLFGLKSHPTTNQLISLITQYGTTNGKMDVPRLIKFDLIPRWAAGNDSPSKIFAHVYDIIFKYDFFKDKKYHDDPESRNLSAPIADIIKITNSIIKGIYV